MPALYASSSIPGTLYLQGHPCATLGKAPTKVELAETGGHIFFAPHEQGYLPMATEIVLDGKLAPAGVKNLSAVLWPGGSIELTFRPSKLQSPRIVDTIPFMQGIASLLYGDQVVLEAQGTLYPLGKGPECGLRALPNGTIAAFAADGDAESLLILSPGHDHPEKLLQLSGEQVLLSQEGDRVRVHEVPLEGAQHRMVREYVRDSEGFEEALCSVAPSEIPLDSPKAMAMAMTAAVLLGAYDDALLMLTPSLQSVVDKEKLGAFFGIFESYTQARYTHKIDGLETLALLRSQGDVTIARVIAFEVVKSSTGLLIDNIRAWEE